MKLKLLMTTTVTCRHFTRSQYVLPGYSHVPKSAFFHVSVDRKAAPGVMDTMHVLDLGSEAVFSS